METDARNEKTALRRKFGRTIILGYCAAALYRGTPQERIKVSWHPEYGYLATANVVIHGGAGDPVAVVGVDISMPGVLKDLNHFVAVIVLCVVGVVLSSMALTAGFFQRSVIRPISVLSAGAQGIPQQGIYVV